MTVASVSDIPISINYTGRDYYAIREQLIARIQNRIPAWTGTNPADFGIALIEAFAYMGDLMSYYIDRNANESFIATATQRDSVVNIAQAYGYIPAGYRAANVTLTFSNSSTDTSVTIPAGTVVSGDVVTNDVVNTVYFTTVSDVVSNVADNNGTVTVIATEGQNVQRVSSQANIYGELLGSSLGTPNQSFELLENPVVDGSVSINVLEGDNYSSWKQVQHLIDYGPYDQVFAITTDANNNVFVNFGDGVSGQIPTNLADIRADYTVGGGVLGNIKALTITNIVYMPGVNSNTLTALQSFLTVTNETEAIGGSEPESLEEIRYAAPLTLRTNNRAVTLEDFKNIAKRVTGVGKANATASTWTSVTIYLAPSRSASDTDLQPGLDDSGTPTSEYNTLATDVKSALSTSSLIGTSVTTQAPTYVDVILAIQYAKRPQYTDAQVEADIKSKIITDYGYINLDFGDVIYPQDVEQSLNSLSSIRVATVTAMFRQGGSGQNTLTASVGEIFRFQESNISISSL
jgi:hypothetical protein